MVLYRQCHLLLKKISSELVGVDSAGLNCFVPTMLFRCKPSPRAVIAFRISSGVFYPRPRVDSAFVLLRLKPPAEVAETRRLSPGSPPPPPPLDRQVTPAREQLTPDCAAENVLEVRNHRLRCIWSNLGRGHQLIMLMINAEYTE